ncbi:MAG: AMP-binding protein [Oscillospiraceae bacterium]|nr:AMP-binding protein [Oscillospiraceae bacterium]
MENQLLDVAARIKALREIAGFSVEQMAEKTDVTVYEYKLLEEGNTDFNFTFIYKCAHAFNVDMKDILEGESPSLSSFTVTRKGEGLPITRRTGFVYNNLAPSFKHKIAEPFWVKIPYTDDEEMVFSTHNGQEIDIVIKGHLKIQINDNVTELSEGDTIYYNSSSPHALKALDGKDCEVYAIVLKPEEDDNSFKSQYSDMLKGKYKLSGEVSEPFVKTTVDENGLLKEIKFQNEDKFNFAYDIVDNLALKCPDKVAMLHVSADKTERRFTFRDISRYSSKTANYFRSLGIKKGDRVMLVLKRHYQFWFSILALHKIGAIVIPATNLLVQHDFEYRFKAAGVSAIVCTGDGDVAHQADLGAQGVDSLKTKIIVGEPREGWHNFNDEVEAFSDTYERTADAACGNDDMLMFFTSGTTGYPKIALHSFKYPLGHYITAKYWHNVNPEGIHFTISDTGWGKALWGKLYGQWMCEACIFTYDFNKFDAHDILPMFAKYHITTFCAPPTMYRFFIKEDLSQYDLSSIEYATTAGEALNPEVFNQFKKATGLDIMEGFGQTETTLSISNLVGSKPKIGSMGKPSPLYDLAILTHDGKVADVGETGEICIKTSDKVPCGLFKGYYNDEAKTREVWYDGYYHTGDTAWKDEDGYYWYVGRVDDVIKSSGYRIGPFEIESVIMELPYVLECAVTAAPDPVRGQVVKATIVLIKGKEESEELKKEIQTYVKKNTAPYKYPRIVEFRKELPKTISGKIKRIDLR